MTSTGLRDRAADVYRELSDVLTDEDRWTQTHFLKARNIIAELGDRIAVLEDERLRDENMALLRKENAELRALLASPAPAGAEGEDIRSFGYARGDYVRKCADCQTKFAGDKYATRCQPCAVVAARTASPAPSPATPPAEARELVEAAHRSLLRLIADYEDVPDATDADGQAVFAEAREVAGRLCAALPGAATEKDDTQKQEPT